jgi:hypothetical protein
MINWNEAPAPLTYDTEWQEYLAALKNCSTLHNGDLLASSLVYAGKSIPLTKPAEPKDGNGQDQMTNRIDFCLWLAKQPNKAEDGTAVQVSPQASAQHILMTHYMGGFGYIIKNNREMADKVLRLFGVYDEPYPYVLRKAPYTRMIAHWLLDPYCIFGHEIFGKYLPPLVPALINWGMSHLMTPRLVGPHLAQTTAIMAQYISYRVLQPSYCLLENSDGDPNMKRFDEKDYTDYNQARNDARLAKAYLRLLREQTM